VSEIIPEQILEERELGSRHLRDFIPLAWHQVEPARSFMANWHIDAICEHLEACTRRQIRRLVINIPPGSSKSIVTSVLWPAWSWTHTPSERWITASYADRIARRDALKARHLLEGPWFRERWGYLWTPDAARWTQAEYRNDQGGLRFATTVSGAVCGEHAGIQLVDDPIKPLDARGDRVDTTAITTCAEWWDETMPTRMIDPATGVRVIIMQRLHDADLSAHVLERGDYVHLNLPMRQERRCVITVPHMCSQPENDRGEPLDATPLGFKDTRAEGELLWPERFSEETCLERKNELGSRAHAAQDQQRPMPSGGGIFKRDWVQYYKIRPKPPGGGEMIQSWDCTFKGLTDSDYVVGQVWLRHDGCYYLVDQVRDQMSFSATCRAVWAISARWPKAVRKLIEDKANGSAVIDVMQKRVPGLLPVNPEGGKIARANAVEAIWESGNVFVPDPEIAPWVHDFIEELLSFNGDPGRRDDQVDAMTQALVHLYRRSVGTLVQAMQNSGLR
jgi:predicted phage terminase large subunit-like protein